MRRAALHTDQLAPERTGLAFVPSRAAVASVARPTSSIILIDILVALLVSITIISVLVILLTS
ncbi:hypothetical protein HQ496_02465 [bacterium]|nr:hypothetical protein [bacterium]